MPCNFPIRAYHSPTGLRFKKAGTAGVPILIPCNQCMGCRVDKVRQWTVRMIHEMRTHSDSCFATFTYSDEHLPTGQTLVKPHAQAFLMRLRRHQSYHYNKKLRYYLAGEYGDRTFRPHYHAILFGYWPSDAYHEATRRGNKSFSSKSLERIWSHGSVEFSNVTATTCAYTAGYITKKITGEKAAEHYRRCDQRTGEIYEVEPEFAIMSRNPGIGASWIDANFKEIYPADHAVLRGKRVKTPAYYDRRLKEAHPKLHDKVTYARLLRARERKLSREDLESREIIQQQRNKRQAKQHEI